MSSLIKSASILAFARVTNYSLLLLSPILLVRFLDTHTFGQYREFVIYATLFSALAAFSVNSNLLYFIPKDQRQTRTYVSNTIWMVLFASLLSCLLITIFRDALIARTSFNFLVPLCTYVLLFTNFDFLEFYWLARKEPNKVLVYSVARTTVRLSAVLLTAIYSPSADSLIRTLIFVEAGRIVAVLVVMRQARLRLAFIDRQMINRQLTFVVPLGFAASLHYLNEYVGPISVSAQLGVVALAIYTIGSYQVPILDIVRGSIVDSIFPDMVREASGDGNDRLRLWKRSNIAYVSLVLPVVVVLFFYADVLIPFVFTEKYSGAVPIFRILAAVTIIQCFEFSTPLRAVNRNKLLLIGNVIMLGVNIGIILLVFQFFPPYSIYGPAIAIVSAYFVQHLVLGRSIMRVYSISTAELLKWRSLVSILGSAAASCLFLVIGEFVGLPDLVRVSLFSLAFFASYFVLVRQSRIEEIDTLLRFITAKLRRT